MFEAIYLCPASPSQMCSWEGKAGEIGNHFYNTHSDLIVTANTFPINVSRSVKQHKLLLLRNDIYLIQIQVSVPDGKLMLKVRYLGTPQQALSFVYTVNIRVGNYGFKWLTNEDCQIIYTKGDGVEIDLQMIKLTCGNMDLHYVICVLNITTRCNFLKSANIKNYLSEDADDEEPSPLLRRNDTTIRKRKDSNEASQFTRNNKTRNSFLQNFFYEDSILNNHSVDSNSTYSLHLEDFANPELKCATCCTEMCPPIYLCMNGHSVCGVCRNEKCRSCHQDILDIRNTDLEDISVKKQHSCKYVSYGCCEKGNWNEIQKHEVNCRFCVYKCCLCLHEGKFSDLKSHFKLLHSSVKIYETLRNKFTKNITFAIISNEYGIFYCTSLQNNGNIEWNVKFCGPEERRFSCDLKIKGKKDEVAYSFRRNVNVYSLILSQADLKAAGLKDKYAVLQISQ